MTIISSSSTGSALQTKFFERIKDSLPLEISLVDELADLLNLSNDSVYRRIRGETSLTLDEIALISNKFKISFDIFSEMDSESVTFNYGFLRNEEGFKQYLENILYDLQRFKQSNADIKKIIYSANDIPLFRHFNFTELAAFKIFYWLKSILDDPKFKELKYNFNLIQKDLLDLSRKIYNFYSDIPSVEIWTEDTITSHIKQIEFYWDAGYFETKEDALLICKQAKNEIENLNLQAEKSSKKILTNSPESGESNFTFYLSEIDIGNNCILVQVGDSKSVYLSFHTFNVIVTHNPRFCNETELWLENIIKKSILISGASSKYRFKFFNKMLNRFDMLYDKIEKS
ncbi:MAG: helix-turn-helix transcriptional regulator [Chlorobi bacterium]|nr:helix-turn-helix transcriptional regulator [Chlorobiota bacterium]